jgi:general secretion pathway protein M
MNGAAMAKLDFGQSREGWRTQMALLQARWQALGVRERSALQIAGVIFLAMLIWTIGIRPAWRTLTQAPVQLETLELQLQDMQRLAEEARELREAPTVPAAQAAEALQAASSHLGSGVKLSISGDRATLTFDGLNTEQLQGWLGEVRSAARARPVEAQMQRSPKGYAGTIVLTLNGGKL